MGMVCTLSTRAVYKIYIYLHSHTSIHTMCQAFQQASTDWFVVCANIIGLLIICI